MFAMTIGAPSITFSSITMPVAYNAKKIAETHRKRRNVYERPSTSFVLNVMYTCGMRTTEIKKEPMYPEAI